MERRNAEWLGARSKPVKPESVRGKSEIDYGLGRSNEGATPALQANRLSPHQALMSNGGLRTESDSVERSCTIHLRQLVNLKSDPSLSCLLLNQCHQSYLPLSCEVNRSDTLHANNPFVVSIWLHLIALSGGNLVLRKLMHAWNVKRLYATLFMIPNIYYCCYGLLALMEAVLAILYSKFVEGFSLFSFNYKDVFEGDAVKLNCNMSLSVPFTSIFAGILKLLKLTSMLAFLVAIRRAMWKIKDDLRWVPPKWFRCLDVYKNQEILEVGDYASGVRVRNFPGMAMRVNSWLIGNLKDEKLLIIYLGYAQQSCDGKRFILEYIFHLEIVAQSLNLAYLEKLRICSMGLWPLWLGFIPPNPSFLFSLLDNPLDGILTGIYLHSFSCCLIYLNCRYLSEWVSASPSLLCFVGSHVFVQKRNKSSWAFDISSFSFSCVFVVYQFLLVFCLSKLLMY